MPSRFLWYELLTPDPAAAVAFYAAVLGWTAAPAPGAPEFYTLLATPEGPIAGLMAMPPGCPAPGWIGYVAVPDVDAHAAQLVAAGGRVMRAPEDVPGIIRFAVVADPDGAPFVIARGLIPGDGPPAHPDRPGHVGWHELHAGDGQKAFAFYAGLFGWTKAGEVPMGAAGVYQLFAAGGAPIGGMMTRFPGTPGPFWLYYFTVVGLEAALERVRAGGGAVTLPPQSVPGGMWIAQCRDPQGAAFALVAAALTA